jgi:hypothetical protein
MRMKLPTGNGSLNGWGAWACAALCAAGMLAGCDSPPKGSTGNRIDPYRTTESDRGSGRASIPAMLEFSDQVAAALAQELVDIDEIHNAPSKVVLELGSIDNKTRTPTTDFEQLRNRIRGQIFQSKLIRQHFMIVEGRQRMQAETERVNGPTQDLLQEGGGSETAKYDAKLTYVLQGDFFESNRNDRRQYYFEFKLTNLATRSVVFLKNFDLGQVGNRENR